MKYIENAELREWVKENLRRAIFQKAHEYAVQTGCGVVVKVQTEEEDVMRQTYASPGACEKVPDALAWQKVWDTDILVCGETGLPYPTTADQAIQSDVVNGSQIENKVVSCESESVPQIKSVTSLFDPGVAASCVGINTESVAMDSSNLQQNNEALVMGHDSQCAVGDPSSIAATQHPMILRSGDVGCTDNVPADNLGAIQQPHGSRSTFAQGSPLPSAPNKSMSIMPPSTRQQGTPVTTHRGLAESRDTKSSGRTGRKHSVEARRYPPLRIRHYHCKSCKKSFSNSTFFQAHVRTYHTKKSLRYPCKYCQITFASYVNMIQHMETCSDKMAGTDPQTSVTPDDNHQISSPGDRPAVTEGKDGDVTSNIISKGRNETDESPRDNRRGDEEDVIMIKEEPSETPKTDEISIAQENVADAEARTRSSNIEGNPSTSFIAGPSISEQSSTSSSGERVSTSSSLYMLSYSEGQFYGQSGGKRIYPCDMCGRIFKRTSHVREHRMTHFDERPFKCEVCGQGFYRLRQLRSHVITHTGKFPYVCRMCNKGFLSPSALRTHKCDQN